ncbi:twin-arginine translocation protein, TatA/E family subunit [Desulfurobacterium thermolithotrophum]|uniref:twin-arginine translocation protein, TatA/E family subunit n=1 Tax=Desulfurobacterium thermolithotrophum TaxID=64160 RepID=UPI0013CFFC18|nr:twin-arginine translocation protein, TatA/E family subunit [Desulfurobacterium thermolithotrophum]
MLTKIILLLIVVGIIFGWDKIINLIKSFFVAKEEFKKGLEGKEETEATKKEKPVIKVAKKD